jgi:hypothetical protein
MIASPRRRTTHPSRLIYREVCRIKRSEWIAVFSVAGVSVLGVVFVRSATWQPTPVKAQYQAAIAATPATSPVASPKPIQPVAKPTEVKTSEQWIEQWKQGKSVEDSFFACVIGSAEGTRSVDCGKTSLYEGHSDPGNGVWNKGSFSYQFGEGLSAEESSQKQLAKIIGHLKDTVLPQVKQAGFTLTTWELINAADVANQAPLCVTSSGGFVERLVEARKMAKAKGWNEYQMVLWARIEAFWDPNMGAYNAGGLRAYDDISKRESIMRDQDRRMNMMLQAMTRQSYKIDGGGSYQPVNFNPVALQQFFDQVKGVPGGRIPNGSRGDRVAPLEYTERFEGAIGLVSNTQVEK